MFVSEERVTESQKLKIKSYSPPPPAQKSGRNLQATQEDLIRIKLVAS